MSIEIQVKSDLKRLANRYRRLRRRVQGDLLNRLAQRTAKHARERIRSQKRSPDGKTWEDRKSARESHPLMVKTRKLLDSIRAAREGQDTINMGTDVEYAFFHHEGTRRMAQRQAIGVGPEDVRDLQSLIDSWVESRNF